MFNKVSKEAWQALCDETNELLSEMIKLLDSQVLIKKEIERLEKLSKQLKEDNYLIKQENKQLKEGAYMLDIYKHLINELPSCNDCAIQKICKICPKCGERVRYNCVYHVPNKEGQK